MNNKIRHFVYCSVAMSLMGCASVRNAIVDGHPNRKTISAPLPTQVNTAADGYASHPATRFAISRGNGVFRGNHGWISNSGGNVIATIDPKLNPWILGNIIYGGIPGFLIDGFTGAMWDPKVIPARLR